MFAEAPSWEWLESHPVQNAPPAARVGGGLTRPKSQMLTHVTGSALITDARDLTDADRGGPG